MLLGWSTCQDIRADHDIPDDATGYFRKSGWHERLRGYALIGEKVARPAPRTVYLDALRWAVYLVHTPTMGPWATGLHGMRLWAEEMTDPKYFPQGDAETLGLRYVSTAINMTMLRDEWQAEPSLRAAADLLPEIYQAADCCGEVAGVRAGVDALSADNFSEQAMAAIHAPAVRQATADQIGRIVAAEEDAPGHLERLIQRYS